MSQNADQAKPDAAAAKPTENSLETRLGDSAASGRENYNDGQTGADKSGASKRAAGLEAERKRSLPTGKPPAMED